MCLGATDNCEGEGEEGKISGFSEGSGNATPGMEGVGTSPGGGRLGIIGWLQG